MKISVQEKIAELESRIAALEKRVAATTTHVRTETTTVRYRGWNEQADAEWRKIWKHVNLFFESFRKPEAGQ